MNCVDKTCVNFKFTRLLNQIISLQVVCRMSVYVAVLSVVSPFF